MATYKEFPSFMQQGLRDERLEELSYLHRQPRWFFAEYLRNLYKIRLESWLVDAIFGHGREHIPYIECVSQVIVRVKQLDPKGEAEILIFGQPCYQKDVAKMIMRLAEYHRQRRAPSSEKVPDQEADTQHPTPDLPITPLVRITKL